MKRQVLDVGDQASFGKQAGMIARIVGERHVLTIVGRGQLGGLTRSDLTRLGGELQVGDWVRVQGTCMNGNGVGYTALEGALGLIVDDYPAVDGEPGQDSPDFLVFVQGEGLAFVCLADQLTRISRAEALA